MRWGLVLLCCIIATTLFLDVTEAKRRNKSRRNSRKRSSRDDYYDLADYYDDSEDDYYDEDYKDDYRDEYNYDDDDYEYDDYDDEDDKRSVKRKAKKGYSRGRNSRSRSRSSSSKRSSQRKFGRSGDFDSYLQNSEYKFEANNEYDDYDYSFNYKPRSRENFYGQSSRGGRMRSSGRKMEAGDAKQATKIVPVVVSKKEKKKMKILTTQKGFYIPSGSQMFGKFTDLHSCQKACAISSTCFAGDFNPWTKKCYGHGNLTACGSMSTHSQLTHFKKVFCSVVDTPRGLVTLGVMIFKGVKLHGVNDLATCVKKCVSMGGGIAAKNVVATINSTPQICFGVDYNFGTHECHAHIRHAGAAPTYTQLCPDADDPIKTPASTYPNPSVVNIIICPLVMA